MGVLQAALPWFVGASAAYIIWHCICALNRMDHHTDRWVFFATAVVAIGAFGELCFALSDKTATVSEALLLAGVAASITVNRREASACPCILPARVELKSKKGPPHAVV